MNGTGDLLIAPHDVPEIVRAVGSEDPLKNAAYVPLPSNLIGTVRIRMGACLHEHTEK